MADPVRFPGSVHIVESLQCGSFTGPAGFLRNEQVNAAAAIGAEKLVHNGSTALTLVSGTLSSTTYVASDLFRVVVTVAGSASAQALGLHASMIAYEATT